MKRRRFGWIYLLGAVICLLVSFGGVSCSGNSSSAPGNDLMFGSMLLKIVTTYTAFTTTDCNHGRSTMTLHDCE